MKVDALRFCGFKVIVLLFIFLWLISFTAFAADEYTFIDLGAFGGFVSRAYDINNSGQVVGETDTPTGRRAFLWENGVMSNLGSLGDRSRAFAINNSGQIVGETDTPAGQRAFL